MAYSARGGALPRYAEVPPNQTLYINNMNDKIKIPDLKCCLLELFSTYGEVVELIAQKGATRKGQAFVVFNDISCATNALRALQGFTFLDKPLCITYAKTKSDMIALRDGSFKPRGKAGVAVSEVPKAEPKKQATVPRQRGGTEPRPRDVVVQPKMASHAPAPAGGSEQPSNVLFVENLHTEVNDMMLTMLFRQYPGFQEARLIKGRNVAFIEYGDEEQAGIAMHGLQDFMVAPEMALKISFAKQ